MLYYALKNLRQHEWYVLAAIGSLRGPVAYKFFTAGSSALGVPVTMSEC